MTAHGRVVHKHRLIPFETQSFPGHKVVLVAEQNGEPYAWVEKHHDVERVITVTTVGTGSFIPPDALHAGSFLMDDGHLVWHVYQVGPVRS